jgi:hypothetical protein
MLSGPNNGRTTTPSHNYRRPTPFYAGQPPRKKHRIINTKNNNNNNRNSQTQRFDRKRPLLLIRTAPFSTPGSSVGSEPEDYASQYECDSEGTSATSNSELSFRGERWPWSKVGPAAAAATEDTSSKSLPISNLREAFHVAVSLVLEHYFQHRGGYKLSPAEKSKQRMADLKADGTAEDWKKSPEEDVFRQRRQRILSALESSVGQNSFSATTHIGPPFTMQRIAEVLVAPERYYTQTHKLCNCLEKLLLVTSSVSAFGGITGGETLQSRVEDREIEALADEKGRLQSQFRPWRLRRGALSSPSDELNDGLARHDRRENLSPEKKYHDSGEASSEHESSNWREIPEATTRASLRTTFDHVGADPHHHSKDIRVLAENRGMANSPPPPVLTHGLAGGILRHYDQDHHGLAARAPSPPILFSGESTSSHPLGHVHHGNSSIHLLQLNQAAAFAGLSPFELLGLHSSAHESAAATSTVSATLAGMAKDFDLESRSSASSDVDSESDDVSFDDSASDRSDGSDSGSAPQPHYEPFSAATRAMALNRMQQRLQHSRSILLTSQLLHPADSEYQTGDSVDSIRADNSGGSDSSSSDVAE